MAFDESVDAAGVRIEKTLLVRGEVSERRCRHLWKAQGAAFDVQAQSPMTKDF